MKYEKTVFEKKIVADVTELDSGIHVLLTGGDCTHIGAVSYIDRNSNEEYHFEVKKHKDLIVSKLWADELSRVKNKPVTVACGIHYDNIKIFDIDQIIETTKQLLNFVICQECDNGTI